MTVTHDINATTPHSYVMKRAGRVGSLDALSAEEILLHAKTIRPWPANACKYRRAHESLDLILRWLSGHPGEGWQQLWDVAAGDNFHSWISVINIDENAAPLYSHRAAIDGIGLLILGRIVTVSYPFLREYRARHLYGWVRQTFRPDLWERANLKAADLGMSEKQTTTALIVLSKTVLVTGRNLDELTVDDFEDYLELNRTGKGQTPGGVHGAWDMVRGIASIGDTDFKTATRRGQLTATEIVERFNLKSDSIRTVLIRYLEERRPALDYSSFNSTACQLATFWSDIEKHNAGIDSLHLPEDTARAWKQRLRVVTARDGSTRERANYLDGLMLVRSFYLDLQEWAHSDPSWAQWAVPSPVRKSETAGYHKKIKRRTANMHQRIRERLPHVQDLVDSADVYRIEQATLLTQASAVAAGTRFDHNEVGYKRVTYGTGSAASLTQAVHIENQIGERINLSRNEDEAFWAWAIIETLHHSGIRIEELAELTHLAIVTYRVPETGESIPLMQIVPSKSNEERLLLVTPELASVLATIVSRLRGTDGQIPLVARYDTHERTTGPILPHLFQRRTGHRNEVIGTSAVNRLIRNAVERLGLRDAAGELIHFRPHDFRRIFATNAVTGGLPIHIAAKILGHSSITTTQTYLAVFQNDVIRAYRRYLDDRRALRPVEEYREPTSAEWTEFEQHFAARKLELGTCGRPYGTPCNHEHACIRCPMLRVDPGARPRLVAIIANLNDRIQESRTNGWLGEVHGLETSLTSATMKLVSLDRSTARTSGAQTALGMPTIAHLD